MKNNFLKAFGLFLLLGTRLYASDGISFNAHWRFLQGDAPGAEATNFEDSSWELLDVPHDWAIKGPFDIKYNARCGGLPFHGTGWYRKTFQADPSWNGKSVRIAFDGAMCHAKVWINGQFVSYHPYGYTGFEIDLTPYLKLGQENVVAVKLSPRDLSSRWYPGAGIYRNVWLRVDNPVHVTQDGIFVTIPTLTERKAVVQVQATLDNLKKAQGNYHLKHLVFNPSGKQVGCISDTVKLDGSVQKTFLSYTNVANPEVWSIETPNLYTLKTLVYQEGALVDTFQTRFGIRKIEYTKDAFLLNGKPVRFQGVCLHHDNGPLGTAFNRRADERKLQIMKDMGVNAVRTSHNPPAPEFLDLCDELGILVVDEVFDEWRIPKVPNAYSHHFDEWSERDLVSFIHRDRNHPSVVMYSLGNEMIEQNKPRHGFEVCKRLADICRREDPTRPNTAGYNYYPMAFDYNVAQQTDLAGMNYKPAVYAEMQKNYPDLTIFGIETTSCTSSRGVYHLPLEKYNLHPSLQLSSYDIIAPYHGYPPEIEFYFLEQNPRILGQFVWTGFDYLGEPTPYGGRDNATNGYWNAHWPARSSYFGAVDLCGLPKDRFYLYQSEWSDKPMVHLLPHWNWKQGMNVPVYVYTNCDEAELFLNGKSLGKRVKGKDYTELEVYSKFFKDKHFKSKYRLSWNVPFEAGTLTVKAYREGACMAEKTVKTAGKPYQVTLQPDRSILHADGLDLSYITVRIEDKHGNLCPEADNLVDFEVEGAGNFKAVGNGNAATTESFCEPRRKAFSGMCMLIVQTDQLKKGEIKVTATSKGLKKAKVNLTSR